MNPIAREAELRRNVIDRLIDASLADVPPAREASLQRWRALKAARGEHPGQADHSAV